MISLIWSFVVSMPSDLEGRDTQVHGDSSDDCGKRAAPQGQHSLFANDPEQGVEDILIVPPLLGREEGISLKSNEAEVRGVADDRSDESGEGGG